MITLQDLNAELDEFERVYTTMRRFDAKRVVSWLKIINAKMQSAGWSAAVFRKTCEQWRLSRPEPPRSPLELVESMRVAGSLSADSAPRNGPQKMLMGEDSIPRHRYRADDWSIRMQILADVREGLLPASTVDTERKFNAEVARRLASATHLAKGHA